MNKKALFTGALTLLVLFAVLPAANAAVLDPSGCPAGNSTAVLNIYKHYNITKETCDSTHGFGLIKAYFNKKYNLPNGPNGLTSILENKPISSLTWAEAYYMASQNLGQQSYSIATYNKDLQYANQMINVQNTPQSRALAYIDMNIAAGSMYHATNNPKWLQKETYFNVMFLQNDPDSIINNGILGWNTHNMWIDPSVLMNDLQQAGYNVSQKAIDFTNKARDTARAGNLNTQTQLKEIGFYKWKKNYITPLINQKAPLSWRVAENIPVIKNNPELVAFIGYHGMIVLLMSIFVIFVIGIVGVVVIEDRAKK